VTRKLPSKLVLAICAFAAGLVVGGTFQTADTAKAQSNDRVFELRTYTTHQGRLDALHTRFADHTMRIFEKHGMTNIGYFSPQESPLAENTLIYLLAHGSREAADASWAAFVEDPEWQVVAEDSQRDGRIIEKLDRIFMDPTSYSQMK